MFDLEAGEYSLNLRPGPDPEMDVVLGSLTPEQDFEAWKLNQLQPYEAPAVDTLAAAGEQTYIAQCSRCHQVDGLVPASFNQGVIEVSAIGDSVAGRPLIGTA